MKTTRSSTSIPPDKGIEAILAHARFMWARRVDDYDRLDTKAQAIVAMVAVLLTFSGYSQGAFLSGIGSLYGGKFSCLLCLYGLVVVFLGLAFIICVWACYKVLSLRSVTYPESVSEVLAWYQNDDQSKKDSDNVIKRLIVCIQKSEDSLISKHLEKAKYARHAMTAFICAISGAVIMGIVRSILVGIVQG